MSVALAAIATLVIGGAASAEPPLQEWRHIDITTKAVAASNICGFTIMRHTEGDAHYAVFYDNTGAIVSEVDTFPALRTTVYVPGTDRSYTSENPAVLRTEYTNGAAIGSAATGILTGLQEKFGDVEVGAGRLVYAAVVIAYDAAGVPLIRGTGVIEESAGPSVNDVPQLRCDAMR